MKNAATAEKKSESLSLPAHGLAYSPGVADRMAEVGTAVLGLFHIGGIEGEVAKGVLKMIAAKDKKTGKPRVDEDEIVTGLAYFERTILPYIYYGASASRAERGDGNGHPGAPR